MKLTKMGQYLALAALVAFSQGAMAQARTGFYAFGAIGYGDHSVDTNTFNTTYALGAPGVDTASFSQKNDAYKLGVGYRFGRYFAAEAAYAQLGKATYNVDRSAGLFSGNFRFTAKPEVWHISALGIYPVSNSFELFGNI